MIKKLFYGFDFVASIIFKFILYVLYFIFRQLKNDTSMGGYCFHSVRRNCNMFDFVVTLD